MSKVEKLDLMGVASLAAVTAVLLVGWIATTSSLAPVNQGRAGQSPAISLTEQGSMKLTVTAAREDIAAPAAPQARVASSRTHSGRSL